MWRQCGVPHVWAGCWSLCENAQKHRKSFPVCCCKVQGSAALPAHCFSDVWDGGGIFVLSLCSVWEEVAAGWQGDEERENPAKGRGKRLQKSGAAVVTLL